MISSEGFFTSRGAPPPEEVLLTDKQSGSGLANDLFQGDDGTSRYGVIELDFRLCDGAYLKPGKRYFLSIPAEALRERDTAESGRWWRQKEDVGIPAVLLSWGSFLSVVDLPLQNLSSQPLSLVRRVNRGPQEVNFFP